MKVSKLICAMRDFGISVAKFMFVILLIAGFGLGLIFVIGSFFFEETTAKAIAWNIAMFFGGSVLCVGCAKIGEFVASA